MEFKMEHEEVETRKARGANIRFRVKWNIPGNKCSTKFFKSAKKKKSMTIITKP